MVLPCIYAYGAALLQPTMSNSITRWPLASSPTQTIIDLLRPLLARTFAVHCSPSHISFSKVASLEWYQTTTQMRQQQRGRVETVGNRYTFEAILFKRVQQLQEHFGPYSALWSNVEQNAQA